MCSIFGVIGPRDKVDFALFERIRAAAGDRGRDGGRFERYTLTGGWCAYLGNWRATPTPELERGPLQPYDGLVHNGTVANDKELGGRDGEIDSQVLSRCLVRSSLSHFVESLKRVKGSYALACVSDHTVLAAVNYKPLHYWVHEGSAYFSSMERHFDAVIPWGQRPARLWPYTAIDFRMGIVVGTMDQMELPRHFMDFRMGIVVGTMDQMALPRHFNDRVVVVASSGLDSTVVATNYVRKGHDVCLAHFRYGCRAQDREAERIPRIAKALGCDYAFIDVPYTKMAGASPLLHPDAAIAEGVPGAEYAHEWVPARNLVLISLAAAYAEANDYHIIATGINLEESSAYPDDEEQMTILLNEVFNYAVQNGYELRLQSPVGHLMKHEIVELGLKLGAPFHHTWSCYRNGTKHCGVCGPDFMRMTAFKRCGRVDPVEYEVIPDNFWEGCR